MSFDSSTPYGKIVSAPSLVTYGEPDYAIVIGVYAPQDHPYHQQHQPMIYAGDHLVGTPNMGWISNGQRSGDVVFFTINLPGQPFDSTVLYTIIAEKGESSNQGSWDSVVVEVYRPSRPTPPTGPNRP